MRRHHSTQRGARCPPQAAALLLTAALALGTLSGCAAPTPAGETSPRGGVLLVLAHPDDETMIGATLGRLKERRVPVAALYATRGEGGKLVQLRQGQPVETEPGPQRLAAIRTRELRAAAAHYGIDPLVLLDEPDAPMDDPSTGKPTRDVARFLESGVWDVQRLRRAITALARKVQPSVVITLRPDVPHVHAHHQAIARITARLARAHALGSHLRQLMGINETDWYPAAVFPHRPKELRVPRQGRLERLGTDLLSFAREGAHIHRSQMVGWTAAKAQPEVLVPLGTWPGGPELARLLGRAPR